MLPINGDRQYGEDVRTQNGKLLFIDFNKFFHI